MSLDHYLATHFSSLASSATKEGAKFRLRERLDSGAFVDALLRVGPGPSSPLICLLPSAQPAKGERQNPVFHRWTWTDQIPGAHILVLSDPSLYDSEESRAGWFVGADRDYVVDLASFIERVSEVLGVQRSNVVLYGSSMGGFGALMLASEIVGARALAEVPQLNLVEYPIQSALRGLERHHMKDEIDAFARNHPERTAVGARFARNGAVPGFGIVTNVGDEAHLSHVAFMAESNAKVPDAVSHGPAVLVIHPEPIGHRPLPTFKAISYLLGFIALTN